VTDYLARLFYLGDRYHGSQYQPSVQTVQGELIDAITQWSGENHSSKSVHFSGRTDKGVHSLGQVVLLSTEKEINLERINKHLPDDIILWAHAKSPAGFQPRFSALLRHYRYYLSDSWSDIDRLLLRPAMEQLVGSNDFALMAKPDGDRNTMTTILNLALVETPGRSYLDIFGTSFLWKFVRKVVTLLHDIGTGKIDPVVVAAILAGNALLIRSGIKPAPPEALILVETVVPLRFRTSKYALKNIKTLLEGRMQSLKNTAMALEDMVTLFSV
jgi:tRNA pseudouridine38-40 synthase